MSQFVASGFAMRLEAVILPELGAGPETTIIVSHWYVGRGGFVWEGERLVEISAGPLTFDVSAPATGRLVEIRGREDDPVRPGDVLGYVVPSDADDDGRDDDPRRRSLASQVASVMTTYHERSAGVIPYHRGENRVYTYLVLHSATVRNPRAKWEFPKGGVEAGESPRQAAGREFQEETSLPEWEFRDGFERTLSYTYIRRGRKVIKTVTYYLVDVRAPIEPTRSAEHVADPHGHWHHWGSFEEINRLLYHTKIRQVFAEAHAWLREADEVPPTAE